MIIQVAKRDTVLGGKTQGPQHHFVFLPEVVSSDAELLDIVPADTVSRIFNIQRYTICIIVHHILVDTDPLMISLLYIYSK